MCDHAQNPMKIAVSIAMRKKRETNLPSIYCVICLSFCTKKGYLERWVLSRVLFEGQGIAYIVALEVYLERIITI